MTERYKEICRNNFGNSNPVNSYLVLYKDEMRFYGYKKTELYCIAYCEFDGLEEDGTPNFNMWNSEHYTMSEEVLARKAFEERMASGQPVKASKYDRGLNDILEKEDQEISKSMILR